MTNKLSNSTSNRRLMFRKIILLFCCISISETFSINQNANSIDAESLLQMKYEQYQDEMKKVFTKEELDSFNKIFNAAPWQSMKQLLLNPSKAALSCTSCKFLVNATRILIDHGKSDEEIAARGAEMCIKLRMQPPEVCTGIMNSNGKEAIYAVRHSGMKDWHICNFFLGGKCPNGEDPRHNWNVTFPKPKTQHHLTEAPAENVPRLKVLQISDIHIDRYYQIGANADCDEPLCCRTNVGALSSIAKAAGQWGNYHKCDAPKWLLENVFEHINKTHPDIDYVMWTGDTPPHIPWSQTKEENFLDLQEVFRLIDKYFKNVTFYPSIGNHESCPIDSFPTSLAPPEKNMSWLYDKLSDMWGRWLPVETSMTIKRGGFYSVLVRPGLRIISVNGNYCSHFNFWLLLNSTDPDGQFAWLIKELQAAEDKKEKVHIIGHIPPGNHGCIKIWSKNFYDIIDRYEGIIMAQFYGHTHFDEFEVFYDTQNFSRPLSVGYIAPSITPWEEVNPSYRIYYVDGDHPQTTRSIIDFETWKMDLDKANYNGKPVWYKSYTARDAYKMPSLLPKDWNNLINRMKTNRTLFDLYHRNYYRDSPERPQCGEACRKNLLCNMKCGRSFDENNLCRDL